MTYQAHNVYDWLHETMPVETVDFCIDGKCSCCGSCCTNFLALSDAEIRRIKRFITANNIKPCCHGVSAPLTERPVDMICPFRDEEKKICTVYAVRPLICRGYQCNKSLKQFAKDMFKKGYNKERRHYINVRLTFFGADDFENQVNMTRVMAMKQKAAFGARVDEWL